MKIVRFESAGATHLGSLHADGRVTILEGDPLKQGDPLKPAELFGPLRDTGTVATVDKLLAPIEPRDILCIGLNYKAHAAESNAAPPAYPVLFLKNSGTLQNPVSYTHLTLPTKRIV